MSVLLTASVGVYLLIAIKVFREDKTELIFDLSRGMVSNLSAEIETQFLGISDKFKLFALIADDRKSLRENLFGDDSEVAWVSLYRTDQALGNRKYVNLRFIETYALQDHFFDKDIPSERVIPFADILKDGEAVWNATTEKGPPLIGYGRAVVVEDDTGAAIDRLTVVGYIRPDRMLKSLKLVQSSDVVVVNLAGQVLIHRRLDWMTGRKSLLNDPLFKLARTSPIAQSVATLKDEHGTFLGAFSRSYRDQFLVLAKASEKRVFAAVQDLISDSLLFALIGVTVALLFAVLLSRSLTEPIAKLVQGMSKVSAGDLSTEIKVNSRDETLLLAKSFNGMIRDLKQSRDELQAINRDLDQKVKDRTRQLEIQSQAAKDAQEALLRTTRLASAGEIAGRAAHEVLNPLTGIMTRVSSIERRMRAELKPQVNLMNDIVSAWKKDHEDGGLDKLLENWKGRSQIQGEMTLWEEDLTNLEAVQRAFNLLEENLESDLQFLIHEGQRISKIIDGMRKLSHLKSDVKTYSSKKLCSDCKNIMADLFGQASIEIAEDHHIQEDDAVEIDRDEFIQAVTNLMRNALQAMTKPEPPHPYRLIIRTERVGPFLQIDLIDNGCGITPENQNKLFELQFTTKSSEEGTGLGLGISRRFIRGHGGDIEFVRSIPYSETVFRIQLPLKAYKPVEIEDNNETGAA